MKKIAVFAHDAGGSELLLELLNSSLHVGEFKVFCTVDSPCKKLLKSKKLIDYQEIIKPNREFVFEKLNLFKPNLILYSTGWQNHFEYFFLEYAKKRAIPSIAFLDNWTNFRERFSYPNKNWKKNLPDFIATHDETSQSLANNFGFSNVVTIKNYALQKQLKEYNNINTKEENILLFLSEPTAKVAKRTYGDANYWGFDESTVFKTILKSQKKLTCKKVVIRLHPSDEADVYKKIEPSITISSSSLVEDISRAKVIIGLDTSVLYLAFLLGKKVISFLPSKKRDFHIPVPKKNQIRDLENIDISSIETRLPKNDNFGIEFALFVKNILG